MTYFVQHLISGLATGSLYALMALGLVLIYRVCGVVNFSHGAMAFVSALVAYALIHEGGQPWFVAWVGAVAVAGIVGIGVEWGILQPARRRAAPVLGLIIATLGVALVLEGLAGMLFGHETKLFPPIVSGPPLRWGALLVTREQLLTLGVGIALISVLYIFFRGTQLGLALRATVQDPLAARLLGIPVERLWKLSWAAGAALGAVSGLFIASQLFLDNGVMLELLIKGFAAAVLGGFSHFAGALVGGVVLGIVEGFVVGYISTELKTTFAFTLLVVALVVRPEGLLGRVTRRRA
jgi:branched-chain amino acid transport system permease protein